MLCIYARTLGTYLEQTPKELAKHAKVSLKAVDLPYHD